jgi:hypothetical protein
MGIVIKEIQITTIRYISEVCKNLEEDIELLIKDEGSG